MSILSQERKRRLLSRTTRVPLRRKRCKSYAPPQMGNPDCLERVKDEGGEEGMIIKRVQDRS